MLDSIRAQLEALAEPDYQSFQQKLLPGVENILGVRLPRLHAIARRIAAENWREALAPPDQTFEETLLRGMILGELHLPQEETLALVRDFIPRIDNWCTCDTFCGGLKAAALYKEAFFLLALECARSRQEFTARFAAVLLLRWWAETPADRRGALRVYQTIRCPAFYARMGVAWGYATFAAWDFEAVIGSMRTARLAPETWNLALQKMRESRRITPEQKELCKQWKLNRQS